jgi:hypothetical protein
MGRKLAVLFAVPAAWLAGLRGERYPGALRLLDFASVLA